MKPIARLNIAMRNNFTFTLKKVPLFSTKSFLPANTRVFCDFTISLSINHLQTLRFDYSIITTQKRSYG